MDHLGLLMHVCQQIAARAGRHVEADDLLGDAYLGLCKAQRTYQPQRGVPFTAYARRVIHGAVIDQMRLYYGRQGSYKARRRPVSFTALTREELGTLAVPQPPDALVTLLDLLEGVHLTAREARIVAMLLAGHDQQEIARELGLSPSLVSMAKRRVIRKVQASLETAP